MNKLEAIVATGVELFSAGDAGEALKQFEAARDLSPGDAVVMMNLGLARSELGQFDDAFECLKTANALDPKNKFAAAAYAEFLVRRGQWRMGWDLWERCRPTLPQCPLKPWDGGSLRDKKILVIQEGTIGEAILSLRFFVQLRKAGAQITFACDGALHGLLERHPWVDALISDGSTVSSENYDCWVSSFSLPSCFMESVEDAMRLWPGPYLESEYFPEPLVGRTPKFGICSSAGPYKTLTKENLADLDCLDVRWIQLPAHDPEATAEAIDDLDMVITVDSDVMHIAGAVGKPTIVLLSNADWKFLLAGSECVFYPNMRLFRNRGLGFDAAVREAASFISNRIRKTVLQ